MNRAHELLVSFIQKHPEESYSSIAQMLNTSASTITRIAQRAGLPPRGGIRLTVADVEKLNEKTADAAEANDTK